MQKNLWCRRAGRRNSRHRAPPPRRRWWLSAVARTSSRPWRPLRPHTVPTFELIPLRKLRKKRVLNSLFCCIRVSKSLGMRIWQPQRPNLPFHDRFLVRGQGRSRDAIFDSIRRAFLSRGSKNWIGTIANSVDAKTSNFNSPARHSNRDRFGVRFSRKLSRSPSTDKSSQRRRMEKKRRSVSLAC